MAKYFAIFVLILSLATFSLNAQETRVKVPNQNWGVGVQLETHDIFGGTLAYAMNPDMHIGLNFGFLFDGGAEGSGSSTYLTFGPYFKFFLSEMRMRSFFPFIKAQFLVSTESVSYKDPFTQKTKRTTNTETKIMGIFGSEWYPVSSLGIYGGIRVLELNFDPFQVILGIGYPMIGIEWFF
ncbi:MAG: hypothetical protein CH6_2891 [Candidatus Kapaibacterium sp.]|nr:MAG: hypothetical protein CH6_2891 [Candidatus Kapabacteria bacterium]